ncbi:MAG: histidine--tRNA ligase, partial [Candidatus Levybacteria bacterium CG10_big_fil_rev_8_21_14_0_10_36_7]
MSAKNVNEKQKKQPIQTPKGTHDILSDEYFLYKTVLDKGEEIASYYGFKPIQTPHLEKEELFTTTLGETTDVVEKEMFKVKGKEGDNLVLRPEGTAPIMRAYLEHGMHTLPQPVMLQYQGSFFRHERPQRGRFREFTQFGLEILGEKRAIAEATIIQVMTLTLSELGIKQITVRLNSIGDKECQGNYKKELLKHYKKDTNQLCKDCQRRIKTNPLRLLDCKEEKCAEIKSG